MGGAYIDVLWIDSKWGILMDKGMENEEKELKV